MLEFEHYPPSGKLNKGRWPEVVRALIAKDAGAGAPEVIDALLCWLQDWNWPGCPEACKYLLTLGEKVIPHAARVLDSDDDLWQYWTLLWMRDWPQEYVRRVEPRVKELAMQDVSTADTLVVNQVAAELLVEKDLLSPDEAREILARSEKWHWRDAEADVFKEYFDQLRDLLRKHLESKA